MLNFVATVFAISLAPAVLNAGRIASSAKRQRHHRRASKSQIAYFAPKNTCRTKLSTSVRACVAAAALRPACAPNRVQGL